MEVSFPLSELLDDSKAWWRLIWVEIEVAKSSAYEKDREGAQYPNEGWGCLREENGTNKISCATSIL